VAVTTALWQSTPRPSGFLELWCQQLHDLHELAKLRARIRLTLTGSATVRDPLLDHWSERLVLVADELSSNALRHGGRPVATALARHADTWMVTVRDSSTGLPPEPARGRDPGLGGLGLYLVADLTSAHGWQLERGAKTVWATLPADD
jgi:signal transduction histidine kinase